MAYNKVTRPGTDAETYGDYTKKKYQEYSPKKRDENKVYGIGEQHRYSTAKATEPITTKVQKELGNIDDFQKKTSSKRPIHTTNETYKG